MSRTEMERLGWDELDVLLVSGDAYVDHPSFAMALLGSLLIAHGFRTGIVTQPRWNDPGDLEAMGRPRLLAGVSAGAIDSMLAHYTAFRKKRSEDAYTPGGLAGARPNRACIVYANLLRRAFPGLPVVLGGIEASLRRITHYDFWTDALRKPVILDAKADAVVYGMGERALVDIARRLEDGQGLAGIPGTVTAPTGESAAGVQGAFEFPSHEAIVADPRLLMRATLRMEKQVHDGTDRAVQRVGERLVVIEPPSGRLTTAEMDRLYALPFARMAHPAYDKPIPAEEMIRDSVTSHRGCGGGCSFCTLALHQGRRISSRSRASIEEEVGRMAESPGFRGQITDVGGPSANMWGASCDREDKPCKRPSCMTPTVCPHFRMDQKAHLELLRRLRRMPGVKGVRVASGVRFDLALQDMHALQGYLREFVGGQLKIAPEHVCDNVLRLMRKPGIRVFEEFLTVFSRESERAGKEQYVIPYLMSAFPGTTDEDMRALGRWLAARGWKPRQVQCFIPIPGAVATAMYVAGITPDGKRLSVACTDEPRVRQHRILSRGEDRGPGGRPAGPSRAPDRPAAQPPACKGACPRKARSTETKGGRSRADRAPSRVRRGHSPQIPQPPHVPWGERSF
jgi:uncharacterized radical SAM protein YgiQ